MKAAVGFVIWTLLTLAGSWLVTDNLSAVGRLGHAALGMIALAIAAVWLVAVVIGRIRARTGSLEYHPLAGSPSSS